MRSSKSRSRSKANRPRTLGNIVNRVFDSSGPEGKVRGTPQQIIEKYQMLARDAQLSNDRVAAENFSQHAEHYTRMLAEAMREMAAEQESRQQFQQNNPNGNRDRQGEPRENRGEYRPERGDQSDTDQPYSGGFAVVDEEENGLVELPEANRQQPRRDERPRENRGDYQPRRDDHNRADQQRNDQPRRDEQPRNDGARGDQPRRDDGNRGDQQRRFENRRDDRPREPRVNVVAEPVATVAQPAVELPRFESPAELVAQVEKTIAAPGKIKPPKPETSAAQSAEKPVRAPRPRKPTVAKPAEGDASEAAE